MKTIYFANHAQFEGRYTNLGDWAIFEQMIGELAPLIKNKRCRVVVASAEPKFTRRHYPVIAFQRGGLRGIWSTLKWLWKSDLIVIGGGEIVQDLSSMVYIPYQLIRPFIGKLFGKKLFAYAIGIGEEWEISWLGKLQAKIVLDLFDIITVRDRKSYRVLTEYLGVKKPDIFLTADPALNLKKSQCADFYDRPYAVMSVRSVYHRTRNLLPFSIRKKLGLVPAEYYKEIEIFKQSMAGIASEIIDKYGWNIVFLNTYTGKSMSANDDKFSMDVINKIPQKYREKVSVIGRNFFPRQIKAILGKAELILSVPLHPLILGASEGVPLISFAYASKSSCFMEDIGMKQYTHRVVKIGERVEIDKVMEQADVIINNHKQICDDLSEQVDSLCQMEKKNIVLLKNLLEIV